MSSTRQPPESGIPSSNRDAQPTTSAPPARCTGLTRTHWRAYRTYASAMWGPQSQQARPLALHWLFDAAPHSRGSDADALVALSGDRVVASHLRMRVPWRLPSGSLVGATLHDLATLPDHRDGTGMQLILRALAGERLVLAAGLSEDSRAIYDRMRMIELPVVWQRKIVRPVRAARQAGLTRLGLGWTHARSRRFERTVRMGRHKALIATHPSWSLLQQAAAIPWQGWGPDMDADALQWRFFHPQAPTSVLAVLRSGSEVVGRLVLSIGYRYGARVARLADARVAEEWLWPKMVRLAERAASHMGAGMMVAAHADAPAGRALTERGWKTVQGTRGAVLSLRGTPIPDLDQLRLWGGAWDFGVTSDQP